MRVKQSDIHQTGLERPYANAQAHAKAYRTLKRFHARGKLPQVEDGTGDPLADFVEILGIKR